MFADGPDAQAEPGPEQDDVDEDEQHQRHVHDHVLLEQHLAEEWDLVESADIDVRQPLGRPHVTDVLETVDAVGEENRESRRGARAAAATPQPRASPATGWR